MTLKDLQLLRGTFEQERRYNELHCMSTTDEEDVLSLIDAEIARQTSTGARSEEVQRAIERLSYWSGAIEMGISGEVGNSGLGSVEAERLQAKLTCDLAIEALKAWGVKKPDCSTAEWSGGKCCGYGKGEYDDEPIDACKACPKQVSYGVE